MLLLGGYEDVGQVVDTHAVFHGQFPELYDMSVELSYAWQRLCTRNMLPIIISVLVLHRGATVHIDDLAHLLLVLLASILIPGSSLPRARVVGRPLVNVVALVVRCLPMLHVRVGHWASRWRCLVVLREATLLGSELSLFLRGEVVVIVDAAPRLGVGVSALALATCSCAQCIQFSGKRRLRLDERSAVITHGLVASIGVLGEQGESRRDQEHDEENEREDGVEDEEDNTHDSGDNTL